MSSEATSPEPTAPRSMDIQAVSKTAQILELLAPQRAGLTVAFVAKALGMNRTTAHRYLTSMEAAGLLDRGEDGYEAGALVVQVGALALGRRTLLQVAPEHLRALCDRVHLTVTLSTWGVNGPVIVHVEEDHSRELLLTVAVGTQLHLESAHSQVWMAFSHDRLHAERLLSMLPPQARERMEADIETTRDRGLAARTSPTDGYVALAAPVFDTAGLTGVIALLGTQHALGEPFASQEADALTQSAAALSAALQGLKPTAATPESSDS